ncbi:non-ribosomal peptide synthetase terminal domain of unknown function [Pseudonocardia thermophila]|uniref:Carrier domain-containing protein n=1 Tax=Pseudonocardia thermophila TaxID=1848 RepID=A0A1M7B7A4_PSETH|nr:Pls/PosA family non-ribosomal peptide synthetase [Pseudonocardia thermophila]SHL50814.1 non-ribosomal peptide synthetase terminal domain of unknown function [Pseudonocardia thermophila]
MNASAEPVPDEEETRVVELPRHRLLRRAEAEPAAEDLAGQQTGDATTVVHRRSIDEELSAARAAVGRLRNEVAGLLEQLQKMERQDPDATVAVPAPKDLPPADLPSVEPTRPVRTPPAPPSGPARPAARRTPPPATRPAPPAGRPVPQAPRPTARPTTQPTTQPPARPATPRPAQPGVQPVMPQARPGAAVCAVSAEAPAELRASAPAPAGSASGGANDLQAGYAAVLADVLGVPTVSTTANFFDDLGADSMVMARFCAKVRSKPELPNVAIRDIYQAPTIAELAAAGAKKPSAPPSPQVGTPFAAPSPAAQPTGHRALRRADLDPETVRIQVVSALAAPAESKAVGTAGYLLCGFGQLLFLLGYPALLTFAFAVAFEWVFVAPTVLDVYLRSAAAGGGLFLATVLLPIAAKWLLVGRWKATQFPVWSLRYFRFWLVKTLIRTNPLVRFVGTPLYTFYLRLLGAKIGKGALILSPTVPVCTDLITIGAGAVVRKAASFTGYRALAGQIHTGPVTIGEQALVGEATVLDIGSSVGDRAQLGHSSALHAGQSVPPGERWHGSPAEPTTVDYRGVPAFPGGAFRRFWFSAVQLVLLFGVVLPLGLGGVVLLVRELPQVQALFVDIETAATHVPLHLDVVILGSALFFGTMLVGGLVMTIVPRLLSVLVRPGRPVRMYGISYWALRTITRLTNSKFATRVFGDSSYIVGYLRAIGYEFGRVEQTGSNFGTAVAHDVPFLCRIGSGTVVADGLTMLNTDYSPNAFSAQPVRIGAHSFLGNAIFYPARARVGDDCLLATKVMVPIDGPVRQGVGLLGSPSFEIPRTVDRDARLALGPEERRRGVRAKARHNLVSIALLLLSRWIFAVLTVLLLRLGIELHLQFGPAAIAVLGAAEVLLTFGYFILLDATVRWLAAHRPQGVSIYDRAFWRHERYWKVAEDTYMQLLNGTPLKAVMWRALGVKAGRRLFDDGVSLTERTFVTIGDDCTFNERSVIQCHSQENDAFKSDHVSIGSGVTLGVGSFVHYGTRIGDGAVLEADSFLMKGEEMPPHTRWGGNPTVEMSPINPLGNALSRL